MSTISAGTTSTTTLIHSGDTTGSLVLKTNDTGSGGTTAVTIDTSQNVGIGTSSPTYQTQIYGSGQQTAALTDAGSKGGSLLLNTPTVSAGDGGALLVGAGGSGAKPFAAVKGLLSDGANNTTGSLAFSTRNATTDTALTERMRIDSSGNVGIGTSSPNKKLEVLGAGEIIRATSNNAAADQLISVKNNSGTADCSTNIFFADRYAASSYASSYIRGTTSGTSALIFATGGTNFTNIYDAGAPTERMRIDSSGNVLVKSAAGLGYGTGSGGTVTQATNKSTAVTLNKPTGQITMNNASLGANTDITFTLNNSLISTTDIVTINATWPTAAGRYQAYVTSSNSGSCQIVVRNRDTSSAYSDAVVLNFAVIKGATS